MEITDKEDTQDFTMSTQIQVLSRKSGVVLYWLYAGLKLRNHRMGSFRTIGVGDDPGSNHWLRSCGEANFNFGAYCIVRNLLKAPFSPASALTLPRGCPGEMDSRPKAAANNPATCCRCHQSGISTANAPG